MKKRSIFLLIAGTLLCMYFFPLTLSAQKFEDSHYTKPRMEILGQTQTSRTFSVEVKLPYSGVLELRLVNGLQKVMWNSLTQKCRGKHRVGVSLETLDRGAEYEFLVRYKGQESRFHFSVPLEEMAMATE